MSTGRLFIAGLWLFGLVCGAVIAFAPQMLPLPVPHFTAPLIAALAVDVMLLPAVRSGQIFQVTMNERAVGVIGSSLVSLATFWLLTR